MITAQLNCNTGIDVNKKLCGLTILERALLSCYYAGIKEIEIVNENDQLIIPESVKKFPDLTYTVKISDEKASKENSFDKDTLKLNVSSVVNKEYIVAIIGQPETVNQVYEELSGRKSYKKAEKALLNSCRKPGDVWISYLYRYASLFFTRFLCKTPVTPNMITAFFVLIAAVGSLLVVSDEWYLYYIGLVMQPLAIVFDCVDGEIARIKYAYSKNGEWLDTAGDNMCTLFFVTAIAYKNHGIYQNDISFVLGIMGVASYVIAVGLLLFTLFKSTDSGSLQTINKDIQKKGRVARFFAIAMKRNLITIYFMVLGFFYFTQTILILNIIGGIGLIIFSLNSLLKSKSYSG